MVIDEVKSIEPESNDKSIAKRWKNRRRMAWISLLFMLFITVMILFTNIVEIERLKILTDVITWFYFSCASIIGAYMGFATYANIKDKH